MYALERGFVDADALSDLACIGSQFDNDLLTSAAYPVELGDEVF